MAIDKFRTRKLLLKQQTLDIVRKINLGLSRGHDPPSAQGVPKSALSRGWGESCNG